MMEYLQFGRKYWDVVRLEYFMIDDVRLSFAISRFNYVFTLND